MFPFSPRLLQGQIALVTGGGTGIGRATAVSLARAGADIALWGRRRELLDETAALVQAEGRRAHCIASDIRDADNIAAGVTEIVARLGPIDILVNNAGGQFMAPAEEISVRGFQAVHRLAVESVFAVTTEVARQCLLPRGRGVVIFMAFSPRRGIRHLVHATSARAAVENLASGLALEWGPRGVRTVAVAPGTIATDGLREAYTQADIDGWASSVPLGRLGTSEDVAQAITFLASPAASYIAGTTLTIDGGQDAWGHGPL
ncbi:SDR family oxidoreductase [Micrococcales bacterium 31B]|nr:SDR family oxidoreductase [Micrococcales bacterium 31B]